MQLKHVLGSMSNIKGATKLDSAKTFYERALTPAAHALAG